jgi:hypothetical protein
VHCHCVTACAIAHLQVIVLPFLRLIGLLATSEADTAHGEPEVDVQALLMTVGAPKMLVRLVSWAHRQEREAVMVEVRRRPVCPVCRGRVVIRWGVS